MAKSKPIAQPAQAQPAADSEAASPAADASQEQSTEPAADETEAAAPEAAARSLGVFLRRECVDGTWYPHGTVLDAEASICIALNADGALDLHPAAVQFALDNGAAAVKHERPETAAE